MPLSVFSQRRRRGGRTRIVSGAALTVAVSVVSVVMPAPAIRADTVITTIGMNSYSFFVSTTPNGDRLYVTNNENQLSVIDTATDTVMSTSPIGSSPDAVAFTPTGDRAFISLRGEGSVRVLDTATNTAIATIPVGDGPTGIAVSPNRNRAYVGNSNDKSVSVIDTATNTAIGTIPVGDSPHRVALTPNGDTLYVSNWGDKSVSVIDTATNTVTTTISVGLYAGGMAITPSGSRAYVATSTGVNSLGGVAVIDTATNTVTTTIPVGNGPMNVAITSEGDRAYVTNHWSHTVSVIDTATNAVIETIEPGKNPSGIAAAPNRNRVYVTAADPNIFGQYRVAVIAVEAPPTIRGTAPIAELGRLYSYTFATAGTPRPSTHVTSGALPDGMSLTTTGVLSGSPTAAGSFPVTITATNGVGTDATLDVTLDVAAAPAAPMFTDAGPVTLNTVTGTPLTHTFTVTGNPTPTVTVLDETLLPNGMTFIDGVLSGTPTAAGTYTFVLQAANGVNPDLTLTATINVAAAPVVDPPATGSLGSLGGASSGPFFGSLFGS